LARRAIEPTGMDIRVCDYRIMSPIIGLTASSPLRTMSASRFPPYVAAACKARQGATQ